MLSGIHQTTPDLTVPRLYFGTSPPRLSAFLTPRTNPTGPTGDFLMSTTSYLRPILSLVTLCVPLAHRDSQPIPQLNPLRSGTMAEERLKRRRLPSRHACIGCRKRKHRCDGERPECGNCRSRWITCLYSSDATTSSPSSLGE